MRKKTQFVRFFLAKLQLFKFNVIFSHYSSMHEMKLKNAKNGVNFKKL